MCGGPDQTNTSNTAQSPPENNNNNTMKDPNHVAVDSEDCVSSLLELAANDDVEAFKDMLDRDTSAICKAGMWYCRKKGSRQMVLEPRTPLMVAATYGSLNVLKLILEQPGIDVNYSDVPDKSTALHCAASGGSVIADEIVKLLLEFGADSNVVDVNGLCPFDVIVVPHKLPSKRASLEFLLANNASDSSITEPKLSILAASSGSSSPPLSSSPDNGAPSSLSESPKTLTSNYVPAIQPPEKKEYPIDPSLPDISNSIYSTDEFRMYQFKIRPCSRAYSHDWTECPFVHPGENARRRDPRKYHYSCVPCPEFRKGTCRRADMCEYAHGVFECWLHPAQYRTRLCKDGTSCDRRVCFFAHMPEELRPLYVSTGSAVPSPRAAASAASVMDMAAAMNLFPCSPSSMSGMYPSPFSPQGMSPPANGCSNSPWPQPNVPALHLPGSNIQSSRLRSSLSARDMPPNDFNMLFDNDIHQHMLDDLASFPQPWSNQPSLVRAIRTKTLAPSNLEELFCSEMTSSPRYSDQAASVFSPTHKSAVFNQFQQQQSMLAPINTSNVFSPQSVEHPLMQASLGLSSPGRMSPRNVDPISPMSARLSGFGLREHQQQQQLRSLSSREFGTRHASSMVGSPVNSWSNWGSPSGKVDWSVNGGPGVDEPGRLRRSSSFEGGNSGEEPDLSWVQSLVKESPPETKDKLVTPSSGAALPAENLTTKASMDSVDHSVIGAWLEQMQLDQFAAQ